MSESNNEVLWQHVKEHTAQINNLTVEQRLDRAMIERLFDEGRARDRQLSDQHTEILKTVKGYAEKVDSVMADLNRREGAKEQKVMSRGDMRTVIAIVTVACTIIGVILTT